MIVLKHPRQIQPLRKKRSCNIVFFHEYRSSPFPRKQLNRTAQMFFHREKKVRDRRVNVILCSDYRIRKLNAKYRNCDRTTDVLSFPFDDEDLLGEVYISLQRAVVQAGYYRISYADEVNRLLIHGLAHLLGFDHTTEKGRKEMESYEKRYY